MFCKKCGAAVSDGDAFCPKCGTRVEKEETVFPVSYNESNSEHTEEQNAPAKEIKENLVVIWICSVLPVVRITPAPVTAIICFASVTLYAMFVIKEINGSMEWFTVFALPLIMILAVFIGLDSALAANKIATSLMPGIVAAEAAVYSFIFGILWSHYYDDAVYMPRISVVFACGFLMLSVILAAMGYVKMINRKK